MPDIRKFFTATTAAAATVRATPTPGKAAKPKAKPKGKVLTSATYHFLPFDTLPAVEFFSSPS